MISSEAMTCPIRRHISQPVRRSKIRESTNLSLGEDGEEDVHNIILDGQRYNNQQRSHGVEGTRLNEHGGDGLAHSTDSAYPHGIANAPGVDDQSDNDHEGEEDVE